jgi:DNA helicase-2/ATP-dependent DNA helicase PcrA
LTTAVLGRTNRSLRTFEEALGREDVPYFLLGKSGFYSQPEIRSSLAIIQCAVYPSNAGLSGAIRSPYWISKFLPKTKLLARLKELDTDYWPLLTKEPGTLVESKNVESVRNFVQFIHGLSRYRGLPAGEATKKILIDLRAFDYFSAEESIDNSPVDNLKDLVRIAGRFPDLRGFLDYARKVSAASKTKKGVALGTLHSSKGLEFNTVFFIGCQEGLVPHAKSTDDAEERNLLFVGASRAEHRLYITYSGRPSPYLKDFIKEEPCPEIPNPILGSK